MKLSHFDSRPLANKGQECLLVDPITKQLTKTGVVMLGADSDVYQNKSKELQERRRNLGRAPTPEEIEADGLEIIAACIVSWHDMEDDEGKELPCNNENRIKVLKVPAIGDQLSTFTASRINFFKKASGG